MLEFFNHLVPADFMPHGYCYLWDPWLVWLNVASDGLITLSYYCIPVVLIYFIHKRRDLPFNWIFWMFGGFILACDTTHLMEVWNVWHASYALAGVIKAITEFGRALASSEITLSNISSCFFNPTSSGYCESGLYAKDSKIMRSNP